MCPEQFRFREVKGKDTLVRAGGRFYSIHLDIFQFVTVCLLKVGIGPPCKYSTVCNLGFVAFSGFKLYLALQVNVSGKEKPLVDIVVEGVHGNPQLRMVRNDHVWGLPLDNERFYNHVDGMQFFFRQVNAGTGVGKAFGILSVGSFRVVIVFRRNLAFVAWDRTAVTDKGRFVDMAAFFTLKSVAYVAADVTGTAMRVAEDKLVTGIGFFCSGICGYRSYRDW